MTSTSTPEYMRRVRAAWSWLLGVRGVGSVAGVHAEVLVGYFEALRSSYEATAAERDAAVAREAALARACCGRPGRPDRVDPAHGDDGSVMSAASYSGQEAAVGP